MSATNLLNRLNAWLDRIYANRVYQRLSGPLVIVALLFAMVGVGAAYLNGRADAERTADLLKCTDARDAYSADSSQTLRDVTQARDDLSQERGKATIAKERALVKWTDILLGALADRTTSGQASPQLVLAFAKATSDLNSSARALQATERELRNANRDLKQARLDNPIVPPASEVCATGTFVPPKSPA